MPKANPLQFVTLLSPEISSPSGWHQAARTSSLAIDGQKRCGSPDRRHLLAVLGVLPHGCEFKPATAADRDMLVQFLQRIPYPGAQPARNRRRGRWLLIDSDTRGVEIQDDDEKARAAGETPNDTTALRRCIADARAGNRAAINALAQIALADADAGRVMDASEADE